MVHLGEKTCIPVTREFKELLSISIAAGKFVLIHPCYTLIRDLMKMDVLSEEQLDDLEVRMQHYELGEIMQLENEELFFIYSLLEITCRLFVSEIEDDLRIMAIHEAGASTEEYIRVRNLFLKQAEDFLHTVVAGFAENEEFSMLNDRFLKLNALA